MVDLFYGNGTVNLPEPRGIARHWNWLKAQTGNTHPGACRPFGMISICPYSGMYPTGYGLNSVSSTDVPEKLLEFNSASGITHFHPSGIGNQQIFYNYLKVTPLFSDQNHIAEPDVQRLHEEFAQPGYYTARFENFIEFELTAAERSAIHRYNRAGKLRIDLLHGGLTLDHEIFKEVPEQTCFCFDQFNRVTGEVTIRGITIFFCISCSSGKPVLFCNGNESRTHHVEISGINKEKPDFTGVVFFNVGLTSELQIGFSFHSLNNAIANQEKTKSFDAERSSLEDVWEEKLGRIHVEGGSEEDKEIFYSSLYHALIKPGEYSGDSPFEHLGVKHAFFDFATMWDQYKTALPLIYTVYPETGEKICNFISAYIKYKGYFPVALLLESDHEDRFMKQASALACYTIYDAFVRGVSQEDSKEVLNAIRRNLEHCSRFAEFAGKGMTRPVSHTLDLSGAAKCVADIAEMVGDKEIFQTFLAYSGYWKNVYVESSGLLLPNEEYYEGSHWNYSFRLLHDMAGRIQICGSKEKYIALLDQFFGYDEFHSESPDYRKFERQIINDRFEGLNNETDMESPYAYISAGRHDRTAEIVRAVMRYQFGPGVGGLPGNEDSGGLSSWYVWSSIGLFPVSGQPFYYIGSPIFDNVEIKMQKGIFRIKVNNNSLNNIYVKSVKLNGTDLNTMLLPVNMIKAGNVLELTMSDQPG